METSIIVRVCLKGGTHIARVGVGKRLKSASSTNHYLYAAWAAAAKYFGVSQKRIALKASGFCPDHNRRNYSATVLPPRKS